VVGISVEERTPISAVTMRIAEHAIAQIVRGLVPEDVLLGDATDVWSPFDRIQRLAASAMTLLAARVDEAGDWKRAGARSAADHMVKLGGTTAHAARRALETSKQVAALPVVAEALRGGELSTAQGRRSRTRQRGSVGVGPSPAHGARHERWRATREVPADEGGRRPGS
jgi:hypothetical protein